MKLPLELLGLVIDHLAIETYTGPSEGDSEASEFLQQKRDSLKACSLSSRFLHAHTRRYIFRAVTFLNRKNRLNKPERTKLAKTFNDLLDQNPELITYIRKLEYGIHESDFADEEIQRLLTRLTMLQKVMLQPGNMDWQLNWASIPPRHLLVIYSIIRRPSVTSLSLQLVRRFPLYVLSSITHIKKFTFHMTDFVHPATLPSMGMTLVRSRLHELHLGECNLETLEPLFSGTSNCLPVLDIRDLQVLDAIGLPREPPTINAVFSIAKDLAHFHIKSSYSIVGLDLHALKKLRSLHLKSTVQYTGHEDTLSGLTNLFAMGNCYPCLESISIHIRLSAIGAVGSTPIPATFNNWMILDKILTTRKQFPALKDVQLKVVVCEYYRLLPGPDDIRQLQGSHFALLSNSNGDINFDFDTVYTDSIY